MKLRVLAAALSLSIPFAAQAEATAAAQLTNFRYEVIDLDLADGIDAKLTLDDTGAVVMAGYYASLEGTPLPDPFDYHPGEGTAAVTHATGNASATLAANGASASASFHGPQGELFGQALSGHNFTLTANTRLVLYADATVSGTVNADHYGYSNAITFISYRLPGDAEDTVVEDSLVSYLGLPDARALTIGFSTGDASVSGIYGFSAGAYGTVAAVPEPSTYAMLGLGLAGIGWCARRRRER
ncbi:PEP-CTERM sorting domain-containing protein [Pseudoduganella chitinolytica]|uniref:PEP-CTERM sorting domain-containing protein n=1 Tax=Pseudoduganella chitinolytica TaxID=34070 RepID=A0ABY8BBL3_9BURK|nr:PEP-CTERM sorting domain-containing protein [Pseudoduganella chitinolytica]WEF33101.1 PEP-CTERM sorting domain-containing protein [Pseudoduganella chitinolytica]